MEPQIVRANFSRQMWRTSFMKTPFHYLKNLVKLLKQKKRLGAVDCI